MHAIGNVFDSAAEAVGLSLWRHQNPRGADGPVVYDSGRSFSRTSLGYLLEVKM